MSVSNDLHETEFPSNPSNEEFAEEITYHRLNICGYCGNYAMDHPYESDLPWEPNCNRSKWIIGSTDQRWDNLNVDELTDFSGNGRVSGDFQDTDQYGFPIVDYGHVGDLTSDVEDTSYRASLDEPVDDEFSTSRSTDRWSVAYDSAADERAINAYRDKFPEEQTVTLDQYREGARPNQNSAPVIQNTYFEGDNGFLTEQAYDEHITELYHKALLNVFTDKKTQHLRCGSIKFVSCTDGSVNAVCVRNDCTYVDANGNTQQSAINVGSDPSRELMEEFIVAVIRHGNNHSHEWFHKRVNKMSTRLLLGSIGYSKWTTPKEHATYYKVHAVNCDLTCDPQSAKCANSATSGNGLVPPPAVLAKRRFIRAMAEENDKQLKSFALIAQINRREEAKKLRNRRRALASLGNLK